MIYCEKTKCEPRELKHLRRLAAQEGARADFYMFPSIKEQLMHDQHGKCIYCECKIGGDFGHIEHFRPKGGYTIPPHSRFYQPGYYFLAYNWQNLLLSCAKCNVLAKRNAFPLLDERMRDIPRRRIKNEVPLLINPTQENPLDYLCFHEHIIAPCEKDGVKALRARATIEIMKLNARPDLVQARLHTYKRYENLRKFAELAAKISETDTTQPQAAQIIELAKLQMAQFASPDEEFSAMFVKKSRENEQ